MIFKDRFTINIHAPLEMYNSISDDGRVFAEAFSAMDNTTQTPCLALRAPLLPLSKTHLLDYENYFTDLKHFLFPLEMGHMKWEAAQSKPAGYYQTFIFSLPKGEKLLGNTKTSFKPWKEKQIIDHLITPFLQILTTLKEHKLHYHSLRPSNIYINDMGTITFGENIIGPWGFSQAPYMEPLNQAQCVPFARTGNIDCDLHALGTMILILLNGKNPWASLSYEKILYLKATYGSYNGLVNHSGFDINLPTQYQNLLEVIRRLLEDSSEYQISIEDLKEWCDKGKSLGMINHTKSLNSSKSIKLASNHDIINLSTFALEVRLCPQEAIDKLKKEDLTAWIRTSLPHNRSIDNLSYLLNEMRSNPKESDDEYIIKILTLIDPTGPCLWVRKAFSLDALGSFMLDQVSSHKDHYEEFFNSMNILEFIKSMSMKSPNSNVLNVFYTGQTIYHQTPTYAFERCLYYLNPTLHCLSPLFKDLEPVTIKTLLPSLNQILGQDPTIMLDKHIIAFMVEHFPVKLSSNFLNDIENEENYPIAILRMFSHIYKTHELPPLLNLKTLLKSLAEPVLRRYHHKAKRKEKSESLQGLIESGNIQELVRVLVGQDDLEQDWAGWRNAKAQYAKLKSIKQNEPLILKRNETYFNQRSASLTVFLTFFFSILSNFLYGYILKVMGV